MPEALSFSNSPFGAHICKRTSPEKKYAFGHLAKSSPPCRELGNLVPFICRLGMNDEIKSPDYIARWPKDSDKCPVHMFLGRCSSSCLFVSFHLKIIQASVGCLVPILQYLFVSSVAQVVYGKTITDSNIPHMREEQMGRVERVLHQRGTWSQS